MMIVAIIGGCCAVLLPALVASEIADWRVRKSIARSNAEGPIFPSVYRD